jgi:hypothetical protein
MWVSLDPVHRRLVPYLRAVSARLEAAFATEASHVALGAECWHATIHFHRATGLHLQNTPAASAGRAYKPAGVRSVARTAPGLVLHTNACAPWRLAPHGRPLPPCDAEAEQPLEPQWQWCAGTDFDAPDHAWHAYPPRIQQLLEGGTREFTLGVRSFTLECQEGTPFAHQWDAQHAKSRLVRRILARPVPDDRGGGDCALCMDDPEAGASRRYACGHTFHPLCLQPVLDAGQGCPLCRGSL